MYFLARLLRKASLSSRHKSRLRKRVPYKRVLVFLAHGLLIPGYCSPCPLSNPPL
jgi:hypothetical protein